MGKIYWIVMNKPKMGWEFFVATRTTQQAAIKVGVSELQKDRWKGYSIRIYEAEYYRGVIVGLVTYTVSSTGKVLNDRYPFSLPDVYRAEKGLIRNRMVNQYKTDKNGNLIKNNVEPPKYSYFAI